MPMLKNLDTNYVEILPAPGIGQYLEVMQFWIHKSGSDLPPTHTPIYRLAISPDASLSEAEASGWKFPNPPLRRCTVSGLD